MTEQEARSLVTETGRKLLEDGLVVRTWGNISCRFNEEEFLITPSGLDYMQTTDEDLVVYNMWTGEWEGEHKPSSEKGIHALAYKMYRGAEFVIHTHQPYATALSVYGFENMDITDEEWDRLGGVASAAYGLPGTKFLQKEVEKAMKVGAHAILLEKHGALIIGATRDEAYARAQLLEEVCKKNWLGQKYISNINANVKRPWKDMVIHGLRETYPNASWAESEATITWSRGGKSITAQLDDMAQMIGRTLTVVEAEDPCTLEEIVYDALATKNAVLVKGFGAIVNGMDEDDTIALGALVDKACITALHTNAARVKRQLSAVDCKLMHTIYQKKYSKLK